MTDLDQTVKELRELRAKSDRHVLQFKAGRDAPMLVESFNDVASAHIGTIPYRGGVQDCGDPECDCWEIATAAEYLMQFFALSHNTLPALLDERDDMKRRLRDIASAAGNPDPVEACRIILDLARPQPKE